jgi:hypothetical protein
MEPTTKQLTDMVEGELGAAWQVALQRLLRDKDDSAMVAFQKITKKYNSRARRELEFVKRGG